LILKMIAIRSDDPTFRQSRSQKISGRCPSGQTNSALGYEDNRALPLGRSTVNRPRSTADPQSGAERWRLRKKGAIIHPKGRSPDVWSGVGYSVTRLVGSR